MNKVYKVIYSKTRNAFVVVSELVTSHTKAHSTSGMGKKMLSAMVLSSLLLAGPTYTAFAADPVTYDSDNEQRISLNNADGNGTVIANVANGQLAAASKEAVNGSQLYETNTHISDILDALNKSNAAIGQAQTDITRMKTQNITFKSDINTLKTQVGTGWNATIDGAKVKNINPADNSLNFTAGDDIAVTDPGNGSIKIGVKATGKVEAGNTHIITGNDVYQAIKDMPTTDSLSGKANTALDNINAAGKKVITDLAQNSVQVAAGTNTRVTETTTNGTKTYTVNVDDTAIQKAVQPKLDEKADKSLGNLDAAGKKVITDLAQNSVKMASGNYTTVTETMENGTKVYAVNVDDKALQQSFQPKLDAKADTNLGNITTAGKKVITDLAQNSVKVAAGTNTRVTETTTNDTKTYTVNVDDAAIEKSIQPKLDQKANKDLDNLSDKGKVAIKDAVKDDLAKKANVDASNLSASDKVKWQEALGTGEINETSTGLVTGKIIYEAIKDLPTTGGDGLVKYDKETKTITVAANKDATTVDFSGKDSDGNTIARTVTGIVADATDPTSAANVGYVDDAVGQLAQSVSRVAHELTRDINKVGAGAAALASLHPGEFDPDNKFEFSAGYGHYKGANAGAIGAYYHPNEDTIINVSGTIGNGSPMLSAGVSFKLGSGGNNTLSRTALTKQVAKDQQVIKAMADELNAMKDKMNQVFNLLDPHKQASFKDVPADHWAAKAVETLHGNDAVEGYPDGEFKGDREMTRYEYAQMLYKAAQKTK
ncbi:ESPR-type extended signal peptide-containing protein [Veillonella magna]|uniref:YadA-like family protein n=1 Tax=Veillonella magna TaxID=464322 RepID=A0ABS2GDJ0_9FIRM|nr:ESPR-type extended signal peptide-containing protein [Veillonella magna]MBM6823543.1 YadA-like family protein [Veillonella magna]MBM6911887.1 YadA-like family protein [Veillonella magna]